MFHKYVSRYEDDRKKVVARARENFTQKVNNVNFQILEEGVYFVRFMYLNCAMSLNLFLEKKPYEIINNNIKIKDDLTTIIEQGTKHSIKELSNNLNISEDLTRYVINELIKDGFKGLYTKDGEYYISKEGIMKLIKSKLSFHGN